MRIDPARKPPGRAGELELFTAASGALSARLHRGGGLLHLHSSVNPEAEATYYEPLTMWADLVVLLGCGLGYHVDPFLDGLGADAEILLVDFYAPCVERVRRRLSTRIPNRLHIVSGERSDWRPVVETAVRSARSVQIIKHPASYRANKDFYDGVAEALRPGRRTSAGGGGGGLLFYGSFFLEEELKNALERTEGGVALFRYNDIRDSVQFGARLERAIQERRPAFILSVNMKGFDANGAVGEIAARCGVPVVVWFVDDPHPILVPQAAFVNDAMIGLTWERAYLPWLGKQGFGATGYLPLAGDPSLFNGTDIPVFHAEVAFVGSSMGRAFLEKIASQFLWDGRLGPLAAETARLLLADNGLDAFRALRCACRNAGVPLPFSDAKNLTWFISYCIHTASMLRRTELVGACIPRRIAVFGDPEGWREIFGEGLPCHGDIDYRTRLGGIYRGIDINLNITSRQMPTAVNQRLFDIPLANGFVLTDRQADCCELFSPDETATYGSREELVDKLSFFRSHPEERRRISRLARARILSCHTYDHRVSAIGAFVARPAVS